MAQVIEILPYRGQGLIFSCILNTMAADDLAMQGARPWTAIVMTYFSWNILISAPKGQFFLPNVALEITWPDASLAPSH